MIVSRARATLSVLRQARGQLDVPFLPRERIERMRDARVREIVRHAAETVPHFRELFAREGLDPAAFDRADALASLPPMTKAALQRDPRRFQSTSPIATDALVVRTTGSTGAPLAVAHDRNSVLANSAFSLRERAVVEALAGRRGDLRRAFIGYPEATVFDVLRYARSRAFLLGRGGTSLLSIEAPVEQLLADLERARPDVLFGSGTYLEALFRMAHTAGIAIFRPRVIVYVWDAMSLEGRGFIRETYGVPVVSAYSAIESFKIGFLCELGRDFHLHEDLCHVRIVGADGRPVPTGDRGEVVISNLVNRATVLLEYHLGDLARLRPPGCDCGRTSWLLSGLEGRVDEIVHLPDGSLVHPGSIAIRIREVEGVVQYQVVQHARDRFEARLATVDAPAFDRAAPIVAGRLRELLTECEVDATRMPVESGPGGKLLHVVALPAPPGPGQAYV